MTNVAIYPDVPVEGPSGTVRQTVRCEIPPNKFITKVMDDIRRDGADIETIFVSRHNPCIVELLLKESVVESEIDNIVAEFVRKVNKRLQTLNSEEQKKLFMSNDALDQLRIEEHGSPFATYSYTGYDRERD